MPPQASLRDSNTFLEWLDKARGPGVYSVPEGTEVRAVYVVKNTGDAAGQIGVQLYDVGRDKVLLWETHSLDPGETGSSPLDWTFTVSRDYNDLGVYAYHWDGDSWVQDDSKGAWDISMEAGEPAMRMTQASVEVNGEPVKVGEPVNAAKGSTVSFNLSARNNGFKGQAFLKISDLNRDEEKGRKTATLGTDESIDLTGSFQLQENVDLFATTGHFVDGEEKIDDSAGDWVIQAGAPSINVTGFKAPSEVRPGAKMDLEVAAKNTGLSKGKACIWLTDYTDSNNPVKMDQHSLTLDPGEEKKTTFTVDATTEEGTYTLCTSAHPGSCLETGAAEKGISAAEKVCRDIKVSEKPGWPVPPEVVAAGVAATGLGALLATTD